MRDVGEGWGAGVTVTGSQLRLGTQHSGLVVGNAAEGEEVHSGLAQPLQRPCGPGSPPSSLPLLQRSPCSQEQQLPAWRGGVGRRTEGGGGRAV